MPAGGGAAVTNVPRPLPPGLPPEVVEAGAARGYRAADGALLRYRVVRARPERQALLYLHGIESHGGWFLPAALALRQRGLSTFLLDRRGSGLNIGTDPGDAASAAVLLDDVARLRDRLRRPALTLVGLSWGGKLALASALQRPAGVRSLVLITPGLAPKVDLAPLQKLRLALSLAAGGRARIDVPIEPAMFTTTPRYLEYIRGDPLRLHQVSARFLMASRALDRLVRRRMSELRVPLLCCLAEHDSIIDNDRTRDLLARAPGGLVRVIAFEGATHSIQFDHTRELVAEIDGFLEASGC